MKTMKLDAVNAADFDRLAQLVDSHADYRVLRRVPTYQDVSMWPLAEPGLKIAVVDTETMGLDPARHPMLEVAITILELSANGEPAIIHPTESWLQDPQCVIPDQITQITGIDKSVLEGRQFDQAAIEEALTYADMIVAHNARFDRAFMVRHFPVARARPWACSLSDLDWLTLGNSGRSLSQLLSDIGRFDDAHRAGPDCWALAWLLIQQASDGLTFARHLLDRATQPHVRVEARLAPFQAKDGLKAMGCRWDPLAKVWFTEAPASLEREVMTDIQAIHWGIHPVAVAVDPLDRYG